MKNTQYISYLLFVLLFVTFYGCTPIEQKEEKPMNNHQEENNDVINPSKCSMLNNIERIKTMFNECNTYYSKTSGTVKTKAIIFNYTQNVESQVIYSDNILYKQSVSYSTLKKVALKTIFDNNNVYYQYASEIQSINDILWNNEYETSTFSSYLLDYGTSPYELTSYIIDDETIIQYDITSLGNSLYSIELSLDPNKSVEKYKIEMKKMSESNDYPEFKEISLEIIINSEWQVIEINIQEKYDIKIPVLGLFSCVSDLNQKFYYEYNKIDDFRND